ncbi:MAG: hypothetical protein ACREOU_16025 [Candidatus Eiseniibacteriota bacterium]
MRSHPGIEVGLTLVSSAGEVVAMLENMEDGAPEAEFALFDVGVDDGHYGDCYLFEVRTRA